MRSFKPSMAPDPFAAAAALGGAYLQHRSANKATKASERAGERAYQFEREQFEYEKAQRAKEEADRRMAWDAYQRLREPYRRASAAVMKRWGFDVPDEGPQVMPPDWQPGMDVSQRPMAMPPGAEPLSQPPMMPSAPERPRLTLGNLSRWNEVIGLG